MPAEFIKASSRQNKKGVIINHSFLCAPGRIRICSLLLRKQTLYPIELRGHESRGGDNIPQRGRTVKASAKSIHGIFRQGDMLKRFIERL